MATPFEEGKPFTLSVTDERGDELVIAVYPVDALAAKRLQYIADSAYGLGLQEGLDIYDSHHSASQHQLQQHLDHVRSTLGEIS